MQVLVGRHLEQRMLAEQREAKCSPRHDSRQEDRGQDVGLDAVGHMCKVHAPL